MTDLPDSILTQIAAIWPDAVRIRFSGRCPLCKRPSEYSFVQPRQDRQVVKPNGETWEECGYWCACGWSNAGRRKVEEDGSDGE